MGKTVHDVDLVESLGLRDEWSRIPMSMKSLVTLDSDTGRGSKTP